MRKKILKNMEALCAEAAYDLTRIISTAIDHRGEAHIFLAGGSTPRRLYKYLATSNVGRTIPWGKVHIYFGDERNVPSDDPDCNYNMANQSLLKWISVDPTHIHRIQGELSAEEAAEAYNNKLKYCVPSSANGLPNADLIILGLGPDGHVASLFPDTDILDNTTDYAAAVWVEKLKTNRISITYPVINNAENVWLFVSGEEKREIVDKIFNYHTPGRYPAERIDPQGILTWYLDEAAAYRIDR